MLVPIPSLDQRFKVKLALRIMKPCQLEILAYDSQLPYSDYERKKIHFKKAGIYHKELSFPISPKHLHLEIINAGTGGNHEFKLVDFQVSPLEQKEWWANTDQDQFMDFAIHFSKKAGARKIGFYDSKNQEYLFQYLPKITDDFGVELPTPARISRLMPRVQISKKHFKRYTVPMRAAILSHEACHWFLNTRSQEEADLCGLKYFLDFGFSKKQALASVALFDPTGQSKRGHTARTFIHNY